nr:PD-(D/E)XK nuclease family protein [[Clostridium] colinum]
MFQNSLLYKPKKVIDKSKTKVLFNTYVLNFKRLAYRVFSELGLSNKKPLEDIGQAMVLRKILYKLGKDEKLKYFSEKSYSNIGLLEKIGDIIKEFFEFGVDIENLDYIIKNIDIETNENLALKLNDLKEIYTLYKDFIKNEYITDEGILDILAEKIDKSNLITKDTQVFIYGFESLNNQEINIIYKLFEKCEQINIYFTLNTNETYFSNINPFDYYFYIKSTINRINDKVVNKLGVKVEKTIYLNENKRHKDNEELYFLEENFLKYNNKKFENNVENINICCCKNKYTETEKVCSIILDLVKSKGYNFKDIAVVLGDLSYQKNIKMIFNKYKIPYFLDDKKKIINHCLVELIMSALDIIIYNFQYESIFRYLRTGILDILETYDITKEDIDIIENYVIKYGIKGDKWKKEFKYGFYENSIYTYDRINNIRQNILKSLHKLDLKKNKKYTSLQISRTILDFMVDINIEEAIIAIMERDKELFSKGIIKNVGIVDEHMQVFNGICEILQKFVDILGEEKMTIDEYSKILKSAFEKQTISIIPPTQDQVLIGDFNRTKITDNKILIAMGINEGNIPQYKDESPFISDNEKVYLLSKGVEMRATTISSMSTDMLNIYSLILKPKNKLYLTYSLSTLEGATKKPSIIIEKIKGIFPNLKEDIEDNNIDLISCPEVIFDNVFKSFNYTNNLDDNVKDIFTWFLNDNNFLEKIEHIKDGLLKIETNTDDYINKELLDKVYENNTIFSSVSKLEEFKKCPFSYFLKYILNIKERDTNILDYLKLGNIYHIILEEFSNKILKDNVNIESVTEQEVYLLIDTIVDNICKDEDLTSMFEASAKYKYYLSRIKKIVGISANAIINQIKEGLFIPQYFEINFDNINKNSNIYNSIKIGLKNNYEMILKGKIDRVDKLFIEDKEYIKILDYKSSNKKLSVDKVYYGLQLQILMYLDTFIKIEESMLNKDILPAGAFYFQVKEDLLEDNESEEKFKSKFDLKGIVAKDENVIKGFNKNEDSKKIKNVSSSETISMGEFKDLLLLSNIVTKEIGNDIVTGNIKVYPYKYKKDTGCENCNYKEICNFEILNKKEKYNNLKSIKDEELWQKIKEKIEENQN